MSVQPQRPGESSFDRSVPSVPDEPHSPSLIDLFAEVRNLGGQIVRSDMASWCKAWRAT